MKYAIHNEGIDYGRNLVRENSAKAALREIAEKLSGSITTKQFQEEFWPAVLSQIPAGTFSANTLKTYKSNTRRALGLEPVNKGGATKHGAGSTRKPGKRGAQKASPSSPEQKKVEAMSYVANNPVTRTGPNDIVVGIPVNGEAHHEPTLAALRALTYGQRKTLWQAIGIVQAEYLANEQANEKVA